MRCHVVDVTVVVHDGKVFARGWWEARKPAALGLDEDEAMLIFKSIAEFAARVISGEEGPVPVLLQVFDRTYGPRRSLMIRHYFEAIPPDSPDRLLMKPPAWESLREEVPNER